MLSESLLKVLNSMDVCSNCVNYFAKKFDFDSSKPPIKPDLNPSTIPSNCLIKISDFTGKACINCIGLAQACNDPIFLEYVAKVIKESGYEFETFNFNFKMPLSLKLRQKYILNALRAVWEAEGNKAADFPVFEFDLKLSIKSALNTAISAKLGVDSAPSEDFVISLEFQNVQDEEELVKSSVWSF